MRSSKFHRAAMQSCRALLTTLPPQSRSDEIPAAFRAAGLIIFHTLDAEATLLLREWATLHRVYLPPQSIPEIIHRSQCDAAPHRTSTGIITRMISNLSDPQCQLAAWKRLQKQPIETRRANFREYALILGRMLAAIKFTDNEIGAHIAGFAHELNRSIEMPELETLVADVS